MNEIKIGNPVEWIYQKGNVWHFQQVVITRIDSETGVEIETKDGSRFVVPVKELYTPFVDRN